MKKMDKKKANEVMALKAQLAAKDKEMRQARSDIRETVQTTIRETVRQDLFNVQEARNQVAHPPSTRKPPKKTSVMGKIKILKPQKRATSTSGSSLGSPPPPEAQEKGERPHRPPPDTSTPGRFLASPAPLEFSPIIPTDYDPPANCSPPNQYPDMSGVEALEITTQESPIPMDCSPRRLPPDGETNVATPDRPPPVAQDHMTPKTMVVENLKKTNTLVTPSNIRVWIGMSVGFGYLMRASERTKHHVVGLDKLVDNYRTQTFLSRMLHISKRFLLVTHLPIPNKSRQEEQAYVTKMVQKFCMLPQNSYELPGKRDENSDGTRRYALCDVYKNLHARFLNFYRCMRLAICLASFSDKVDNRIFRKCTYIQRKICLCQWHANWAYMAECIGSLISKSSHTLFEKDTNKVISTQQVLLNIEDALDERDPIFLKQWLNKNPDDPEKKKRLNIYTVQMTHDEFILYCTDFMTPFR